MLYLEQVFRISATFSFGLQVRSAKQAFTKVRSTYSGLFTPARQCFIQGPVAARPVFVQVRSNLDRFELRTAYQRRTSGQLRSFGSALSLPTTNVSSTGREFSISPTPSPYKYNTLYQTCTAFDGNSKNFEFFTRFKCNSNLYMLNILNILYMLYILILINKVLPELDELCCKNIQRMTNM